MLQMLHATLCGDLEKKKEVAVRSGARLGSNTFSFIFKVPREDTLIHQQEGSLCKYEIIDLSFRFLASSFLWRCQRLLSCLWGISVQSVLHLKKTTKQNDSLAIGDHCCESGDV